MASTELDSGEAEKLMDHANWAGLSDGTGAWFEFREFLHLAIRGQVIEVLPHDHSDIVQQTFLEAHQQQVAGKAPADPRHYRNWLRRILICNLTDRVRSSLRQKRDIRKEVRFTKRTDNGSEHPTLNQLVADLSSPSDVFSRGERSDAINIALDSLPKINQQVVRMRFFEGRSTHEIANSIGRTERAVAGLIHRSLQKLKEDLPENESR